MVNQLTSQKQLQPMSKVLEMEQRSRSELDSASMSRHELIAERVIRHKAKMLDVSKLYLGLGKFQIHNLTDSSNASSIAVGISQFTDCKTISTGGLSSWRWLSQWGQELEMAKPKGGLISLGANDGSDPRSRKALEAVRSKVRASKVMWLAPSATLAPEPRKWVREVAGQFGDRVFELPQEHLQKDGIHLSWAGSKLVVRSLL